MKEIATIKHNDNDREDRVTLYEDADGMVWAQAIGEEPYPTDTQAAHIGEAWSGACWDLQIKGQDYD